MTSVLYTHAASPLGPLLLVGTGDALTAIWLPSGRDRRDPQPGWTESPKPFREAVRQLDAYFAGQLREFDLALAQHLRVIDLGDLDVPRSHGGPQPSDSALGSDLLGRPSEQLEKGLPCLGVPTRLDRQRRDEVPMEQGREFEKSRVGPHGGAAGHPKPVGCDLDTQRPGERVNGRELDDPPKRAGDGRVRVWV